MRHQYLSLFLQRGRFMQTVASVVLVFFTWLLIHPTALAAQTLHKKQAQSQAQFLPLDDEAELAKTLAKIEAKLTRLHERLAKAENSRLEEEDLKQLRTRIVQLDTRAHKNFDKIEQHLTDKGLPAELLQRHREIVATYETEVATLLGNLDALAAARDARERTDKAERALKHLKATQKRRTHQPFDPEHLPFRGPDGTVRKPRETREEFQSSLVAPQPVMVAAAELPPGLLAGTQVAALPGTPTSDDLAPTDEVQLTAEITALAAELDHNPVQIYNWVHDHIAFLPTYGSIQGAHMTLLTQRGNAFDTSSLLIALLRAANIPTRYVYGTVQLPIEQVMNWVGGVTTPEAALEVLAQGGIPSTGLVQGGAITAVKVEHVWVEAWVDFIPSRGAKHREGDTWVPMDAAFKQYDVTPGMDLQTHVPFDAQGFLAQAIQGATLNTQEGWVQHLHQANIQAALTTYQEQVRQFVTTQKPQATLDDMLGTRAIIPHVRPVLAASLPYTVLAQGAIFTELPATLRHHVSVTLYMNELDRVLEEPALHYTISLPTLSTQRLGVTYVPATDADQRLIDSYKQQGASSLPAYLLRVTPLVQLDGQTVATGPADQMGRQHFWSVTLRDPHNQYTRTEQFVRSAGDELVFGINGNGLTEAVLQARLSQLPSETAAENLYTLSLCYWLLYDLEDRIAAQVAGITVQRLPSVGLFAVPLRVSYVFGIPHTGFYRGRQLDVKRVLSAAVGDNAEQVVRFRHQSGWQGSYLEGAALDMVFGHELGSSISAVQLIQEANAQGIPLYTLTSQTLPGMLPRLQIDPDVRQEIIAAVETGKTVLVPAQDVVYGTWSGVGYIIQDPETGAGAYLIEGGLNGGEEGPCQQDLEPDAQPITGVVFALSLFVLLVAFIVAVASLLPAIALGLAAIGAIVFFDVMPAVAWPVPQTAQGLWNALFAPRFGPLLTQGPYPGDGLEDSGTCTEALHDALEEAKGTICAQPGSKQCKIQASQRNCPLAAQYAQNAAACLEARLVVMFTCFNGGDERHWVKVQQVLQGLHRCVCHMDKMNCPPAFP